MRQAHITKEQKTFRGVHMTGSGDDQSTRKCWRLVPIPVVTRVLAVIGAAVLAVFLSGCQGQGPTARSRSAAPSTRPTYRVTATVPVEKTGPGVAVNPGTQTVYVTGGDTSGDAGTVSVIESR
jgi:DNA-binding beta-propeller fold protein YncE